ncbi:uncharacterized protein LOC134178351 [Corticium candelabrum]|uniref:uncharacterized protein LOC134178351 n=1 Tax=Corticium candelabrum TaxID=121492 RepID=UPI002E25DD64|nr:uncharacterized protein LOC134178351 [Corticium candelabrum]
MAARPKKRRRNSTRKRSFFCCIRAEIDDVGSEEREEIEMSNLASQQDRQSNTSKRQAQEQTSFYSNELDELRKELNTYKERVSALENENAELRLRLSTLTGQVTVVVGKDESESKNVEVVSSAEPHILIVYWNCDGRFAKTLCQKIQTRQKWKVVVQKLRDLQSESDETREYSDSLVVFFMGLPDRIISGTLTKTYEDVKSLTKSKPILIPIPGNAQTAPTVQKPPGMELVSAQRIDYSSNVMDALSEDGFTYLLQLLTDQLKQ